MNQPTNEPPNLPDAPGYRYPAQPPQAQPPQAQQPSYAAPFDSVFAETGVPSGDRSSAMWSHLALLIGLIGLVFQFIINSDQNKSDFVADQNREALNFHLTAMIFIWGGMIVSFILMIFIIGFFLMFVVLFGQFFFLGYAIYGAVQANKGVWFRYPINIRMIK